MFLSWRHFQVQNPADTFVDTRSLGKGEVFINGQPLGRFWHIGPQGTLYLPAPWLKKGENEIVVFDLDGTARLNVPFLAHAVLDKAENSVWQRTSHFKRKLRANSSGAAAFGSEASSYTSRSSTMRLSGGEERNSRSARATSLSARVSSRRLL